MRSNEIHDVGQLEKSVIDLLEMTLKKIVKDWDGEPEDMQEAVEVLKKVDGYQEAQRGFEAAGGAKAFNKFMSEKAHLLEDIWRDADSKTGQGH